MRGSSRSVLAVRELDFSSRTTRNPIPAGVLQKHIRLCMARGLPEIQSQPAHGRTMVLAGSGPSLLEIDPDEGDVFALGGAHDWLLKRGIVPHGWINADPMPMVALYLQQPHEDVTYYLCSPSHPFVFDAVERVLVWHNEIGVGTKEIVIEEDHRWCLHRDHVMISGGSTGAMRAPFLGYELGYRHFVFYGVDASGGRVARSLTKDPDVTVDCDERMFKVEWGFVHQALELEAIIRRFPDMRIEVRGQELMAVVCQMANQADEDEASMDIPDHERMRTQRNG